eukprot:jgi/Chlat1/2938/Chrsp2S04676
MLHVVGTNLAPHQVVRPAPRRTTTTRRRRSRPPLLHCYLNPPPPPPPPPTITHTLPTTLPTLTSSPLAPTPTPTTSHSHSLTAPPLYTLSTTSTSSSSCNEPYGLLPCSTSTPGNAFLLLVYSYILFSAARLISTGSELLLEVLDAGLIGGLLLPVLGALPDALLVLVSGLAGDVVEAQEEVLVGVGVLAGSSVLLLSVAWGAALVAGRCDMVGVGGGEGARMVAKEGTMTKKWWELNGTGVTTDEQTKVGARIMMLSTLPFLIVQGTRRKAPKLLSLGPFPWLQQKKIEEARLQYVRARTLTGMQQLTRTLSLSPTPATPTTHAWSESTLSAVFSKFDEDNDSHLSRGELRTLIVALGIEREGYVPSDDQIAAWMREFDADADGRISKEEFARGMAEWSEKVEEEVKKRRRGKELAMSARGDASMGVEGGDGSSAFWASSTTEAKRVLELLLQEESGTAEGDESGDGEGEGERSSPSTPTQIYRKAAAYLVAGSALVAFFADPMVDTIGNFAEAVGVPAFFVAFVVTPFASNASELVSAVLFAKKKRKRNISLTYSSLYGAVTMNNTLCLGVFLVVVYARGLTWDFSSEASAVVAVTFAVGALAATRTTFPATLTGPALALYPAALGLVAFLDYVLGWQ